MCLDAYQLSWHAMRSEEHFKEDVCVESFFKTGDKSVDSRETFKIMAINHATCNSAQKKSMFFMFNMTHK